MILKETEFICSEALRTKKWFGIPHMYVCMYVLCVCVCACVCTYVFMHACMCALQAPERFDRSQSSSGFKGLSFKCRCLVYLNTVPINTGAIYVSHRNKKSGFKDGSSNCD
jgi:hypothetical protein